MKYIQLILIFGLIILFFLLPSCSIAQNRDEAISNSTINILGSYHEDMIRRLAEMFEQKTGCKVNYVRLPTGHAITKLIEEKDHPSYQVYLGSTVDTHEILKREHVLVPYKTDAEKTINPEYVDPDGVWKAQYIEVLSIGVNTSRFDKEFSGQKNPDSLEDLLNPAFKGEIILPDPFTSGTGYTLFASILSAMGETAGYNFITKLNDQVGQYTTNGFTPAEKVGFGEYLICLNFLSDQLLLKLANYPISSHVYTNAGWSMCPVSLVAGAEKNIAAQQFLEFCLSEQAINSLVEIGNCIPVREDSIAPLGGIELNKLTYNHSYRPADTANHKEEILKKLAEIIKK